MQNMKKPGKSQKIIIPYQAEKTKGLFKNYFPGCFINIAFLISDNPYCNANRGFLFLPGPF